MPLSVYQKIFANMGGFLLQAPFLISIAVYTYFENQRERTLKNWANKSAKSQQTQFNNQVFALFGLTLACACLIVVKIKLKVDMKTRASRLYFSEILDKVLAAPINLYFDVTPIGQIQTRFTKDLNAVEGPLYNLM